MAESSIEIEMGTVKDLSSLVIIEPSNAYNRNVTWKSDDPQVVSVTGNVAQPNSVGTTTLTATSSDNPDLKATLTVTVLWTASSLYAVKPNQNLLVGDKANLEVKFLPVTTTSVIKSWTSSNPNVIAISGDGITAGFSATAKNPGTATLTATSDNGLTTTINVNVYNTLEDVTLSVTEATLERGETLDLNSLITTTPAEGIYDLKIEYIYYGADYYFTIDESGHLTALESTCGDSYEVEMVFTDGFGNTVSAVINVRVVVSITDILFEAPEQSIPVGEEVNLNYTIVPEDADYIDEKWSSSDEDIVRIVLSDDGWKAYGERAGNATVTLTFGDISRDISVEVFKMVEDIRLNTQGEVINKGETICLDDFIVGFYPEDATDKRVVWTCDDETIASITQEDGKYYATGLKVGDVSLKVQSISNPSAYSYMGLFVISTIESITAVHPEQYVYHYDFVDVSVIIKPDESADRYVAWECDDPEAMELSWDYDAAIYKPVLNKVGDFTLTGTPDNGEHTCTILVHVLQHVEEISLTSTEALTVDVGQSLSLDGLAVISPENAYNKEVVWSSNDDKLATVTSTGGHWTVMGINPGTTTLTVASADGSGATASIEIEVIQRITGIEVEEPEQFILKGGYVNLAYTIKPSNATYKDVTFSISDENILRPEGEGDNFKILAKDLGEAMITITTKDGNHEATIKVTVAQPVEEIILVADTLDFDVNQTVDLNDYIAAILPENAYSKEVTWYTTNTDFVYLSISKDGHTATAMNPTRRPIQVFVDAKYGDATASVWVEVYQHANRIVVDEPEQTVCPGEAINLGYCVLPNGVRYDPNDIVWTTSDPSIVELSGTTKDVSAVTKNLGNATLIVSMPKLNIADTIHVFVMQTIEEIQLTTDTLHLDRGITIDLNNYIAYIQPKEQNEGFYWYCNEEDKQYLSISRDGHIATTLKETNEPIKIFISGKHSGTHASVFVDIYIKPKSIVVDKPEQTVERYKEIDLSYKVLPEGARYNPDDIVWTTTDREIVRVGHDAFDTHRTDDIHATSRKPGTATLTVSLPKENISDKITVIVLRPEVTSIYCNEIDVMKGETVKGIIEAYPEYSVIDPSKLNVSRVGDYDNWKTFNYTVTTDDDGNCAIEVEALTWGEYQLHVDYPGTTGSNMKIHMGQPIFLAKGWNWASITTSSKPVTGYDAISLAFDGKLLDARTNSDLLYYNEQVGLFGTLQKFNASCYKIKVSDAVRFENKRTAYSLYSGYASKYKQGWNWMWYPYDQDYTWDELKSSIRNAHKGDRIVAKNNGFVEYDGTKWEGSLSGLNSSEGYMYYTAEKDGSQINWAPPISLPQKSLASQAAGRRTILNEEPVWQYNHRLFSDNMTIIATVSGLDFPDDCSIGAFVNGECRGEGRCINGKFFITVHGEGDEPVSFVIHDDITDSYYNVHGSLTFDTMIGTLEHPLPLKAGEKTTAIELPTSDIRTEGNGFYDLSGRRLISPAPGIHIVDGKLILIK